MFLPGLKVKIVFYTYQAKKQREKKISCHMHFNTILNKSEL